MKLALAVAAITAITAIARPADACTCRTSVRVSPDSVTDVPMNATVMVWVPQRFAAVTDLKLLVREKEGASIPVDVKQTRAAEMSVLELVPKQPLPPNTVFEVVVTKKGDQSFVAATFSTGTTAKATTPPKLERVDAVLVKQTHVVATCMKREAYLQVSALVTHAIGAARLRAAIWTGDKIDFTKPPTTYAQGDRFLLGDPTICSSPTLVIPKGNTMKLGIRFLDVAGNASEGREVVVDLTRPLPGRIP